jgi:hypothetical protein
VTADISEASAPPSRVYVHERHDGLNNIKRHRGCWICLWFHFSVKEPEAGEKPKAELIQALAILRNKERCAIMNQQPGNIILDISNWLRLWSQRGGEPVKTCSFSENCAQPV